MGRDLLEPESTDDPEVKRLELALRMAELSRATGDPVTLAKHFAFFYLSLQVPAAFADQPADGARGIERLAEAYGVRGPLPAGPAAPQPADDDDELV